jgi:PAS domain S-box-containing protein
MNWLTNIFRRLAGATDDARTATLLLNEELARRRAETAEERAAFLREVSRLLASSVEYEATLASLARLAVPFLADWCAVDLVQDGGTIHRVAVAHADPTHVRVALEVNHCYPLHPDAPYGAARVLKTAGAELYPEVTDEMLVAVAQDAAHLELLRLAGLASGMCVPLVVRGRVLGAMSFGSTRVTRVYGADDLGLAEELAHRAAHAVETARLHDELRDRDRRHRAIIDLAPDGIITIDTAGRIVDLNPAAERTFGLTRDTAIGRELVDLIVPPSMRAAHRAGLERHLETGETRPIGRRVEMTALRADGTEFPVELAITRVVTDGAPQFTAYLRDLSESKESEATRTAEAALRSVSALAAAAAHEINNPLSVVIAQANVLAREVGVPGRGRIDAIRAAASRIAEVVTDMNRIVRLEQVPSRPHLPDMLDLRRSTCRQESEPPRAEASGA